MDLFYFTFCESRKFHNLRSKLFHIGKADISLAPSADDKLTRVQSYSPNNRKYLFYTCYTNTEQQLLLLLRVFLKIKLELERRRHFLQPDYRQSSVRTYVLPPPLPKEAMNPSTAALPCTASDFRVDNFIFLFCRLCEFFGVLPFKLACCRKIHYEKHEKGCCPRNRIRPVEHGKRALEGEHGVYPQYAKTAAAEKADYH